MSSEHHVTALFQYKAMFGDQVPVIGCSCGELLMRANAAFNILWDDHIAAQKAESEED